MLPDEPGSFAAEVMDGAVMSLDVAWGRALELAWQSFVAGTTPVGAVVTDRGGDIVAEGRGRRYEHQDGTRGHLAYCHIAHAEINALAQLPPTRHYEDYSLLTTLEPCCMCVGAATRWRPAPPRAACSPSFAGVAPACTRRWRR